MTRRSASILAATAVLATVGASVARSEDFTMSVRVRYESGRTVDTTMGWSGRRKVIDAPLSRTIIDLDRRLMTTLDKRAHTYSEASLDQLRAEVDEGTRVYRHRLSRTRKDFRNALADLGGTPRWRFSVRPTGARDVVAGVPAVAYAITGGPIEGEVWITRALSQPPDAREWDRLTLNVGGVTTSGTKLAAAFAKLGGVIVRTRLKAQGHDVTTEAVEVRRAAAPDELFVVAPEYSPARRGA
jgi:hypothetical protein